MGEEQQYRPYPVWDTVLRLLHWWNAVTFLAQATTGAALLATDPAAAGRGSLVDIHSILGYAFAAGILARILWLFVGPPAASWRDLLPLSPARRRVFRETVRYYLGGFKGEPPLYFAHSPLAGVAYLTFFTVAALQVAAGAALLDVPAADRADSALRVWHRAGFFLLLAFVAAHLAAVAVHERVERHRGLVRAMFGGGKAFTGDEIARLADDRMLPPDFPTERRGP
jgi:Ni/Fe-hydrogenase 1 B-type cytochrome subunit